MYGVLEARNGLIVLLVTELCAPTDFPKFNSSAFVGTSLVVEAFKAV